MFIILGFFAVVVGLAGFGLWKLGASYAKDQYHRPGHDEKLYAAEKSFKSFGIWFMVIAAVLAVVAVISM